MDISPPRDELLVQARITPTPRIRGVSPFFPAPGRRPGSDGPGVLLLDDDAGALPVRSIAGRWPGAGWISIASAPDGPRRHAVVLVELAGLSEMAVAWALIYHAHHPRPAQADDLRRWIGRQLLQGLPCLRTGPRPDGTPAPRVLSWSPPDPDAYPQAWAWMAGYLHELGALRLSDPPEIEHIYYGQPSVEILELSP